MTKSILYSILFLLPTIGLAQEKEKKVVSNGSFYLSWGYNTEWYTPSSINVTQESLGNNYTFNDLKSHDHIGWNNLFSVPLSIPQYNYRLGYFFNKKQDLGIELSFDHTKFIVTQGQAAHITGTRNNKPFDTTAVITNDVLRYQLNNGANFFLLNIVKKFNFYTSAKTQNINVCGLGKFGVGPVIPHVDNTIFGKDNISHFQFGGWNTGIEACLKVTFYKHIYLEYTNKLDYARYNHLRVYEGYTKQSFLCYEMVLNIGYTFKTGKQK
jgi:hypothetical protein